MGSSGHGEAVLQACLPLPRQGAGPGEAPGAWHRSPGSAPRGGVPVSDGRQGSGNIRAASLPAGALASRGAQRPGSLVPALRLLRLRATAAARCPPLQQVSPWGALPRRPPGLPQALLPGLGPVQTNLLLCLPPGGVCVLRPRRGRSQAGMWRAQPPVWRRWCS